MRKIKLVEIAAEFGAGTRGASLGIDALHFACIKKGYSVYREMPSILIEGDPERLFDKIHYERAKRIDLISDVLEKIVNTVSGVLHAGEFPFVISGDHSNAAGTIAGVKAAYPDKRLGVIWIDARGDLHTPFSSPTGNVHGMPVAAVLNFDNRELAVGEPDPVALAHWQQLCSMGGVVPKILPEDIVFIGIRDLEEQEWKLIREHKMKYYDNHDVDRIGVERIAEETLQYLSDCDLLYITFDIDSLDASIVPGTGTPVPKGMSIGHAEYLLQRFWKEPTLAAIEFTEINPLLDDGNRTAEVAADLFVSLIELEA